jgi:hypothetical protein
LFYNTEPASTETAEPEGCFTTRNLQAQRLQNPRDPRFDPGWRDFYFLKKL